MLLDMLGILIGFVAVILLLSILVTAIIQTLSSFLRLRHRALALGIDDAQLESLGKYIDDRLALLRSTRAQAERDTTELPATGTDGRRTGGERWVAEPPGTYEAGSNRATARGAEKPALPDAVSAEIGGDIARSIRAVRNDKRVTWLNAQEILKPLREAGTHPYIVTRAGQQLQQATRIMEDKYLQWTRVITFAAALTVAAMFQVSTPALLERLQNDEEFRIRAEAAGEQLARETPSEVRTLLLGPGLAARTAFLEKHPQYQVQLGELTFEARSVNHLVADFETALDAEDNRDALAVEYRQLVEAALANPDPAASREAARRSMQGLSALDLRLSADFSFFREPANLVGVLVTAILLSFGAPFWYRILKELVGLKDALRKKEQSAKSGTSDAGTEKPASA